MEVIYWLVLLGFAILVTTFVVSLYYRRKYDPIFCQLSELLADNDLGETDKTTEKPAKKEIGKEDMFNKSLYEKLYKAVDRRHPRRAVVHEAEVRSQGAGGALPLVGQTRQYGVFGGWHVGA